MIKKKNADPAKWQLKVRVREFAAPRTKDLTVVLTGPDLLCGPAGLHSRRLLQIHPQRLSCFCTSFTFKLDPEIYLFFYSFINFLSSANRAVHSASLASFTGNSCMRTSFL